MLNLPWIAPMLNGRDDAYALLRKLGAPARLIRHAELVSEAADLLISFYQSRGIVIHDAGKIRVPAELQGPGSLHERAGEQLMIEQGVQVNVARCCVTHAAWSEEDVTFEELTVALADKLWKGKREDKLELLVIDEVASRLGANRWDVFAALEVRRKQCVWACLYSWRGFAGGLPLRDHSPTIVKSVCTRSAGRQFE